MLGECEASLQGNQVSGGVGGCLEEICVKTCSGIPGGG
jgi:hypothetical protein